MSNSIKDLFPSGISPLRVLTKYDNMENIDKLIANTGDLSFSVLPYSITLGALGTSEAGYRDKYSNPIDYTSFSNVFGGRESLSLEWDNSYVLKAVKDPNKLNSYWEQTFQVGLVFKGLVQSNTTGTSFEPSPQLSSALSEMSSKTLTGIFTIDDGDDDTNWKQNNILLNQLYDEEFRFFRIPEYEAQINNPNENIYDFKTNKEWYYISEASIVFDTNTKQARMLQITFSTVNNKLIKSGFSEINYLHVSGPGSPYAEPKLDSNKEVILDKDYLIARPITQADVNIYGNAAVSSMIFYGRPIEIVKDPNGNHIGQKIFAGRIVYPFEYQAPQYDQLSTSSVPMNNYYALINATPIVNGFLESWKQKMASSYNIAAGEIAKFEGYIKTSAGATQATNSISSSVKQHLTYWDTAFLSDNAIFTDDFDTSGSEFFKVNPNKMNKDIKVYSLGIDTLSYNKLEDDLSLPLYNLLNYLIFKQVVQLPEDLSQTTPYAFQSLPIVGGFANKVGLGTQGFNKVATINQPSYVPIPLLMPIQSYEAGLEHWSTPLGYKPNGDPLPDPADGNGLVPFDLFKNNTDDTSGQLYGTNTITTAFAFNLSDKIKLRPTDIATNTYENNAPEEISTRELGQFKQTTDGSTPTQMYLVNASIGLVNPIQDFNQKPLDERGYLIDSFLMNSINKSDYKLTFFSQPSNYEGDISNDNSIWTGTWVSVSKMSDNIRQWTNFNQLSYPLYDFLKENTFEYPQNVEQASPSQQKYITREADVKWNTKSANTIPKTDIEYNSITGSILWTNEWDIQNNIIVDFIGTATAEVIPDYDIKLVSLEVPFSVSESGSFDFGGIGILAGTISYSNRGILDKVISLTDANDANNPIDLKLRNIDAISTSTFNNELHLNATIFEDGRFIEIIATLTINKTTGAINIDITGSIPTTSLIEKSNGITGTGLFLSNKKASLDWLIKLTNKVKVQYVYSPIPTKI